MTLLDGIGSSIIKLELLYHKCEGLKVWDVAYNFIKVFECIMSLLIVLKPIRTFKIHMHFRVDEEELVFR